MKKISLLEVQAIINELDYKIITINENQIIVSIENSENRIEIIPINTLKLDIQFFLNEKG